MAQCSEAESCPRDHMGTGGAERQHQKYSQHASGSDNGCTEPWSSEPSPDYISTARLMNAMTHLRRTCLSCACRDCWTLTTVHFLTGCVRDYRGVIMETRRFACQGPIDCNYWVSVQHVSAEEKDNHSSFHCLCLPPPVFMQPETHPCSDECYSLLKDGTGNEAKWVLWEAIRDWGIYYRLLKHLRHVFIHTHMFPWSYISQLLTFRRTHLPLKSDTAPLLSNFLFSVCVCLFLSYSHALMPTLRDVLLCGPWWISWVNLSHRAISIIHPPSTTLNASKCLPPLHNDMTDST